MTISPLHTEKSVSRCLDVPKTTILETLRSVLRMFSYRFYYVEALEYGYNKHLSILRNFSSFDMMKIARGR